MVGAQVSNRAIVLAVARSPRPRRHACTNALERVAGVPLLVRHLRTLQDEGVAEAVVVTSAANEALRRTLLRESSLALPLTFVHDARFENKNGIAVLAARDFVHEGVLLTMGDHLYSPEVVRRLLTQQRPHGVSVLAVDCDPDRCFEIEAATKVRIERGRVVEVGREVEQYNAVFAAALLTGPELVDELERMLDDAGDCTVADGLRRLAARGRLHACDVGDARWLDVGTRAALQRAEAMVRVYGGLLGGDPNAAATIDPDAVVAFAPSWVRGTEPAEEAAALDAEAEPPNDPLADHARQRILEAMLLAACAPRPDPSAPTSLCQKLGRLERLDAAHVLLGVDRSELVDVAIRTFVAPGEEVLVCAAPSSLHESRTRMVGGIPVFVPMPPDDLDVHRLIRHISERSKAVFLRVERSADAPYLAALRRVLRLGLPTVIDEELHVPNDSRPTLAHLLADYPNAILLRSFSKPFGLAGLQLAYVLARAPVVQLLERVKLPSSVSPITVAGANTALDEHERSSRG